MIPLAAALGIRLAVVGVVGLTIIKARPSTLLRLAEDGVMSVGSRAKHLVRSTKREYQARMYAKATEAVQRADAEFEAMTPNQRRDATADQAAILARSAEILRERRAKSVSSRSSATRARRPSDAGHEVSL